MNKKISNIFKGDKVIWMVFFFLCMISIVEVFSASSGLTYKTHNYVGPIAFHAGTIIGGVIVAILILQVPCRYFKLVTPFLLLITVVLLLIVMLGGGTSANDASRWIKILGITIQPEKDVVLILTAAAQKQSIMKAICNEAFARTGERGIAFSVPVSDVTGLDLARLAGQAE